MKSSSEKVKKKITLQDAEEQRKVKTKLKLIKLKAQIELLEDKTT